MFCVNAIEKKILLQVEQYKKNDVVKREFLAGLLKDTYFLFK